MSVQAQGSVLEVTECDVKAALNGFVPSQLANVTLKRNNNLVFDSVGGLEQAKQLLTEVLIWPTKVTLVRILDFWVFAPNPQIC